MAAVTPVRAAPAWAWRSSTRSQAPHGATVNMTSLPTLDGTRFEITFPEREYDAADDAALPATVELGVAQTSTTTGRTIGRRRSRS